MHNTQTYLSNQYSATRDSVIIPSLLVPYFGERRGYIKDIIHDVEKLMIEEKNAKIRIEQEEKRNKQAKRPMTPPPTPQFSAGAAAPKVVYNFYIIN